MILYGSAYLLVRVISGVIIYGFTGTRS